MNMFANHHNVNYTLNNNCASVTCPPEIFTKLLQTIATRNIDILSASYRAKMLHKSTHFMNRKIEYMSKNNLFTHINTKTPKIISI